MLRGSSISRQTLVGLMRESVQIAGEALHRYKLRSGLSMIGVVIGVAGLVIVLSVSQGARADALSQVSALGLQNIILRNGTSVPTSARARGLLVADGLSVAIHAPEVLWVSPLVERQMAVSGAHGRTGAMVLGVAAEFARILDLTLADGRLLSSSDDLAMSRVCVLGSRIARAVLGVGGAVGHEVLLSGESYTVVGVLSDQHTDTRSVGPLSPRQFEDALLVPLTAFSATPWHRMGELGADEIWLRSQNDSDPLRVGESVRNAVRVADDRFINADVVVPLELLKQKYRVQTTFDIVVGSVAAMTLLVAGIGITNVMLTSVLERTAEIGLRRAVGATTAAICVQFIVEALTITLSGSVGGLVLGLVGTLAISRYAGWPASITSLTCVLALAAAVVLGLAAGLYPARRAAMLSPIDAVRYE